MPFEEALGEMEMDVEVLRSHELYERGVYTGVTSEAIEHTDELREILQDVTNRKMPEHWSPYLPRAASGKLTGMRVLEHVPEQTSVVFADEDGWQDSADYSRGEGKLGLAGRARGPVEGAWGNLRAFRQGSHQSRRLDRHRRPDVPRGLPLPGAGPLRVRVDRAQGPRGHEQLSGYRAPAEGSPRG